MYHMRNIIAIAFLSIGTHGQGYNYGTPSDEFLWNSGSSLNEVVAGDPIDILADNIPGNGVPGQDYPILASIPDTKFSCAEIGFPGYFADTSEESGCQVFHICQFDGRQDSFLCPNGTIFNQNYFVCDWWFNVDCSVSEDLFNLNFEIGKIPEAQPEQLIGSASYNNEVVDTPRELYATPNNNDWSNLVSEIELAGSPRNGLYETPTNDDLPNSASEIALVASPPSGLYETPSNDDVTGSFSFNIPKTSYDTPESSGSPVTDFTIASPRFGLYELPNKR